MNSTDLRKQLLKLQNAETNILLKYVNEETGEIDPEAFNKLEKLGVKKEEIIKSATDSFNSFIELSDLIKLRLERLKVLQKTYKTTAESIKKILSKYIPEGEKVFTEDFMISWRKSTAVITDDFFDIETLYKSNPDLVKVTKELKRTEVKALAKLGLPLPEGIKIIKKENIQIK